MDDSESQIHKKDITHAISRQHSRLEHLYVDLWDSNAEPFVFQLSPTLITTKVNFLRSYGRSSTAVNASLDFTYCTTSAKLRRLDIEGNVQVILPEHPRDALHFPGVRQLYLFPHIDYAFDDFYIILSAFPNVADLRITIRRAVPSTSDQNFALPFLSLLYIKSEDRSATTQFLSAMTCPSLQQLLVSAKGRSIDSGEANAMSVPLLRALDALVERSRPPLSKLSLNYTAVPSTYVGHGNLLRTMLRRSSTLQQLSLSNVIVDNELFEELTFRDRPHGIESAICPSLTVMDIYIGADILNVFPMQVRKELVERMITSRQSQRGETGRAIQNVKIEVPGCEVIFPARGTA